MNRIERKKERTARRIIAATMTLIRRQGYEETTMEQIAAAADVAKGTLYNYFPVKEAILSGWIRRTGSQKNRARRAQLAKLPHTRARLLWLFADLLEGVRRQQELFEKYLIYQMQQLVTFDDNRAEPSGMALLGREILRLGQESGEIRADLPPEMLDDLFLFAFISLVKQFYRQGAAFDSRQATRHSVDLFLNGVQPPTK